MIIVRLAGGLGNQLFQYAFGRALAYRHNVPLKVDTHLLNQPSNRTTMILRSYGLGMFSHSIQLASPAEISRYVPLANWQPASRSGWYIQRFIQKISQLCNPNYIIEKDATVFDTSVLSRTPSFCYVAGYWQSEHYFSHISSLLRSELRFAAPLIGRAAKLAGQMQATDSVCVHIRRTDFLTDARQTSLNPVQIQEAVYKLLSRDLHPVLYIFSDDIDWCRQHISVPDVSMHFISDAEIGSATRTHFQLMTQCRHFILSLSTFGWWAAWLAWHPQQLVFHPPHPHSSVWAAKGWISLSEA